MHISAFIDVINSLQDAQHVILFTSDQTRYLGVQNDNPLLPVHQHYRSTTCYIVYLGSNPISWSSK
ncbi:hypothetical protein HanPI659440_Chr08g0289921 [Helianthus annuus]|nr:hypothetical protein HanPI659440_Chr08g0289921 [Helianthus annuus]